jgi:ribosomal protein L24
MRKAETGDVVEVLFGPHKGKTGTVHTVRHISGFAEVLIDGKHRDFFVSWLRVVE